MAADITTGLTGYWKLNDNAASTAVVATVGTSQVLAGAGNTSASSVVGASGLGRGLTFDRVNDYIEGLNPGSATACGMCGWFKPTTAALTGSCYVAMQGRPGPAQDRNILVGFQSGKWNMYREGAYPTGTATDTIMTATANVWQHVCYTSNGTTIQGYLNGVLIFSVTGNMTVSLAPNVMGIGRPYGTNSNYYGGDAQEIRYYDRVLTAEDVLAIMGIPVFAKHRRRLSGGLRRITDATVSKLAEPRMRSNRL